MPKHNHFNLFTILPPIVVIGLIAIFFYLISPQNIIKPSTVIPGDMAILPCSNEEETTLLKDTTTALDPEKPENSAALTTIADSIKSYKNFQDDAYCLHILTTKYIYDGDYQNAKVYFDLLTAKLSQTGTTELERRLYFLSLEELGRNVEFLGRNIEDLERNNPNGLTNE